MSEIKKVKVSDGKGKRRQPGEMATRLHAIRLHCLECTGWNSAETRRCTARECWLWPYRMGTPETDAVEAETADYEPFG